MNSHVDSEEEVASTDLRTSTSTGEQLGELRGEGEVRLPLSTPPTTIRESVRPSYARRSEEFLTSLERVDWRVGGGAPASPQTLENARAERDNARAALHERARRVLACEEGEGSALFQHSHRNRSSVSPPRTWREASGGTVRATPDAGTVPAENVSVRSLREAFERRRNFLQSQATDNTGSSTGSVVALDVNERAENDVSSSHSARPTSAREIRVSDYTSVREIRVALDERARSRVSPTADSPQQSQATDNRDSAGDQQAYMFRSRLGDRLQLRASGSAGGSLGNIYGLDTPQTSSRSALASRFLASITREDSVVTDDSSPSTTTNVLARNVRVEPADGEATIATSAERDGVQDMIAVVRSQAALAVASTRQLESAIAAIDRERERLIEEIASLQRQQNDSLRTLLMLRLEQFMVRHQQMSTLMEIIEDFGRSVGASNSETLPLDIRTSLNRISLDVLATLQRLLLYAQATTAHISALPRVPKPEGIPQAVIDNLPIVPSPGCGECAVCLCEYEPEESLRQLPCQHTYHPACVDKWLLGKASCPLCRISLLQVEEEEGEVPSENGSEESSLSSATSVGDGHFPLNDVPVVAGELVVRVVAP